MELINKSEYDFLRNEPQIKDRVVLLTYGGSIAYGTSNENSDIDLRGIALEKPENLIGFTEFEQYVDNKTDTVIYSFNKIIKLLLNANPNVIEMLGSKQEHYLMLNSVGENLLSNRKMFISQRCVESFGGYANQQLARLENSLARDRLDQYRKEQHIENSLASAKRRFDESCDRFLGNKVDLSVGPSDKKDTDYELKIDMVLNKYPLRDLAGILSEMLNVVRSYGKLNHRNKKKDDNHLDKHAMHLIRLYLMVIDMLEKEEIITYRENDIELLMKIRNGEFRKSDGTYDDSFFDMVDEYESRFRYAQRNTNLPKNPDIKKIEEYVMEINSGIVKGII